MKAVPAERRTTLRHEKLLAEDHQHSDENDGARPRRSSLGLRRMSVSAGDSHRVAMNRFTPRSKEKLWRRQLRCFSLEDEALSYTLGISP
jgi:hypothetical protein